MLIREVAGSQPTPDPTQLLALVEFLQGRAQDTNSRPEISTDALISLAQSLGIPVTQDNIGELITQKPLNAVLETPDPNTGMVKFKTGSTEAPAMPVNKAQDIVAKSAKSAMKRAQKNSS
jgi:hypothetical protein